MKQTNDGFKIAEEDLKIRGPGEILGKKQSGSPSFYVADLSFDYDLLEDAKIMVEDILSKNPKLENITCQRAICFTSMIIFVNLKLSF